MDLQILIIHYPVSSNYFQLVTHVEKFVLSYEFRTIIITEHNLYINDITIIFSYLVDINGSIYNKTGKP